MIVMQQNDSFCKEEKINFFNLHQSNLAINSQNRNLEPDLEMHKVPISTTTPKSKLTPELSNDLRHARLGGLLLEADYTPLYPVQEFGPISYRPATIQWAYESLKPIPRLRDGPYRAHIFKL